MNTLKQVIRLATVVLLTLARIVKEILQLLPKLVSQISTHIRKKLRFSITFKTTLVYAVMFFNLQLFFIVAAAGGFGFYLWQNALQSTERSSRYIGQLLSEDSRDMNDRIKAYAENQGIAVTLFNEEEQPVFTTAGAGTALHLLPQKADGPRMMTDFSDKLYVDFPQAPGSSVTYIQITKPLDREKMYWLFCVIGMGAYLLLVLLITIRKGSRATREMLKPVKTMTATARTISEKDLNTRLESVNSYDELKDMAETFNSMLDRIQSSYERQQQFVSDASHELRTPIAVIQGYAGLLKRWGKDDKAVLEEALSAIAQETDRMQELLDKLLFLARADSGAQKLEKAIFAAGEVVEEVVEETKLVDEQHIIVNQGQENVSVYGDRALIKQVIRICVDNSRKFTPAGGTIRIGARLEDQWSVIIIEDNGAGISRQDLPHIFERFYKADKARTRRDGGTGLGLSIARRIIEKHQGTIKASSQPGLGTQIEMRLPVIKP